MSDVFDGEFQNLISEFVFNEKYNEIKKYVHHGKVSCYDHSITVAYLCYCYAKKYPNKNYDIVSLVRGAMLHDFYLYDWHSKNHGHRPHGFTHPNSAYKNAIKYFSVNKIEKDIILKHMFPLTLFKIPFYKETRLVSKMDKKATFMDYKKKI